MRARKPLIILSCAGLAISAEASGVFAASGSSVAQTPARPAAPAQAQPKRSGGIGDFGSQNNNKPINIEADKLEVFQKEGRAIYSGKVVAVQGDTTMKCTQLIVFFDQSKTPGAGTTPAAADNGSQSDALKKLDCKGPVSVVAKSEGKTQVATGDNATYDRAAGLVTMSGNVTLADGPNVTQCGATFTYNTVTGQALCTAGGPGGRVRGIFEPGDSGAKQTPAGKPKT
ncbi:LptA/OstA family protein [Terrarubrum flagellatum]|uniref:LptA/OstA family protein n=1 Tax=Terrirubrum flagellatum TaxID=2895980 RepID=UPI0031454FF1